MGRIDVHAHLLPGTDDGCATVEESIACASRLVDAGYSDAFCTPHVWPNLVHVTRTSIPEKVRLLQQALDEAGVPLKLHAGGEMNLHPAFLDQPEEQIITYNLAGRFALIDLWADRLPDHFEPAVRSLQRRGITVILAHPERMRAVQDQPDLADYFDAIGLLLQGNLQCFSDPDHAHTRRVAERYLQDERYFLLGSDCHNPRTLDCRLRGLDHAIDLVGQDRVDRLTKEHPKRLLP